MGWKGWRPRQRRDDLTPPCLRGGGGGNIHVHSFEPAQYIENNTDSRNQTIRKPGNRTEQTVKPRTIL